MAPRFKGTPVEETATTGPRFKGVPVEQPTTPEAMQRRATVPVTDALGNVIGEEEVAVPQPDASPGVLAAAGRGAVQGVTFGAGDELYGAAVGAGNWITGNGYLEHYEQARDENRAANAAAEEAHPWAYNTGKIGGNVAAILPAGSTAIGGRVLGAAGSSLLPRIGWGAASGTVLGGAQGFAEGEGGAAERGENAAWGAGFGALGGAAAPVLGASAGWATRWAGDAIGSHIGSIPGMGKASSRMLTDDIETAGLNQVQNRLQELGPDAMLLDASPTLQGRAMGLATNPETRETITAPLTARNHGTNGRLAAEVNESFGPAPVPSQVEAQFRGIRQGAGPKYEAALGSAPSVDASEALAYIGQRLNTAEGSERAALLRAREMLMETDANGNLIPKTSAERLHNVKRELGQIIDYGDQTIGVPPGSMSGEDSALNGVRGRLNAALETQVPGYAEANQQFRTAARASEALESGKRVLDTGENAIHPEDFARDFAGRPIEQQAALRTGVRGDVDRLLGTHANDLVELRRHVMSDGDWNRAKLAQVFGPEEAERVFNAVDRETAFREAYQNVVQGPQSAQRMRASEGVQVRGQKLSSADIGTVIAGAVGGPQAVAAATGVKALNAGGRALQRASDLARNQELARALTLPQGRDMDLVLQATGRRIHSRESARQAAPQVDRLVQALMTAEGIQAGQQVRDVIDPQTLARALMKR